MSPLRSCCRIAAVLLGLAVTGQAAANPVAAQFPPDSLENLKVFSQDMNPRELIGIMRTFALGLGVRCQFCHVGEEGQPLEEFDFPSDEKVTKRKAREMIKMVRAINEQHLADLEERSDPPVIVSCETCHHGVSEPRRIQDILVDTYRQDGGDVAVTKYRALREEYYGSGAYDFGEFMLAGLADGLIRGAVRGAGPGDDVAGHPDILAAIDLLRLNLEFYPESVFSHFGLGEAYRAQGDTANAKAHYEHVLELDPDNRGAKIRLQQLGQP